MRAREDPVQTQPGLVAHGDSHFGGFSAYANALPHSHGRGGEAAHQKWAKWIEAQTRVVFGA